MSRKFTDEEEVQALTKEFVMKLQKAGLSKKQVGIIDSNLNSLLQDKTISSKTVAMIVNKLVQSEKNQASFFANPKGYIMEANPQPSP